MIVNLVFAFSVLCTAATLRPGGEWIRPATPRDTAVACFRRSVTNRAALAGATLEMTSGGTFYAYVNGRRIGADFLAPGFTHMSKRRIVMTYDLGDLLKKDAGAVNEFAVEVSPSWFRDAITKGGFAFGGGAASLCAEIALRGMDGTVTKVPTDASWQAAYAGEVLSCGVYEGERVDARLGSVWRTAANGWACAETMKVGGISYSAERGSVPRIRGDLEMKPVSATVYDGTDGAAADRHGTARKVREYAADDTMALGPGERLVVDFGQNHAGVPAFRVKGPRGARLLVRFGEMLNDGAGLLSRGNDGPEGIPYFANLRTAPARIDYTLAGGGEAYEPRFTFFGYRYALFETTDPVEISGLVARTVTSVRGRKGTIETGDARVNRLIRNCEWGHLSNYLSIPTDCPQRDERLGWTGDTQVFSATAAYCADAYGFLSKWMEDLCDTQFEDGAYPDLAPLGSWDLKYFWPGVTGWADAGIIVPYNMYLMYGDDTIIRENWKSILRYAAFLETNRGPRDKFGDWLILGRKNDADLKRVLSASYWVWDMRMLAEMARAIGEEADAARFAKDAEEALCDYRAHYLDGAGALLPQYRCQTALLYAVKLGLAPTPEADAAMRRALAEAFAARDNHLDTGFLGTAVLMDTLTDAGLGELAVTVLLQRDYPGWLYSVEQGATTIWERWNSYTKEDGFGPVGMNSFNHYSYGAVLGWMYSRLAGIRPDSAKPGFRHILLEPHPDRRLGFCRAAYDSAAGRIESEWTYGADGACRYRFAIPEGATATLRLPDGTTRELGKGVHEL